METRNETSSAPLTPDTAGSSGQKPERASLFEDYIDILYAPSTVFARRAMSDFGVHLLIISVVTALLMFANRGVFAQIFDAQYTAGIPEMMAKNPQLTAEQIETGRGIAATFGAIAAYIATPILLLIYSLLLWGITRVVGARLSFKQSALVTTLAWVPRVLALVAVAIQVAFMDTSNVTHMGQVAVGPSRFMDIEANRTLYQLATGFDVFTIWNAVLIGIGVAVIGKVSGARAAIGAAIIFVLGAGMLLLQ
ncbi:MAG: YIP1 family protein [Gemmatimonadaceae bacterium]